MVICKAELNRKCNFSNKIIKENNLVSLYSKKQNKYFENFIYNIFSNQPNSLPNEIISIIIDYVGYKEKIGTFGLLNYTIWSKFTPFDKFMLKILHDEEIIN